MLRMVAVGIALGLGLAQVIFSLSGWTLEDMNAYWDAALRLREGAALYPAYADPTAADVYRYTPWFAFAWLPLTFLPIGVVRVLWSVALLAGVGAALLPLLRRPTYASIALAAILGSLLLRIASVGNVHPLLIAALVLGVARPSGPMWVGVAASLKVVPILFAVTYAARGEWRRAAASLIVAAVLVAPTFLFDLSRYPADPGELSFSLYNRIPIAWAALAGGLVAFAAFLAWRRSAHAWLAMAIAALVALPRTFAYDFTFLLVGTADRRSDQE
jgi:alpha-1,2-mannosyltransferase